MKILAIETSCDETAISLIESEEKIGAEPISFRVLADVTLSQIELHKEYGGVFPNLAKREHQRNLVPILKTILKTAGRESPVEEHTNKLQFVGMFLDREPELRTHFLDYVPTIEKPTIDAIAVTVGPGLEPTLWVGINFARALASAWGLPLIPINHMEGHIFSALLCRKNNFKFLNFEFKNKAPKYEIKTPEFPALALLISGGHTELVLVKDWFSYEIVGRTKDDAVGEAYDKVARLMNLQYPGGPKIAALAETARREGLQEIAFPRPMIHSGDLDFSFSGLKTAVLYTTKKHGELSEDDRKRIALGFENAVTDVLTSKVAKAIDHYGVKDLLLGGGVAANTHLVSALTATADMRGVQLHAPQRDYTTDNALMIAVAALCRRHKNKDAPVADFSTLTAQGTLSL